MVDVGEEVVAHITAGGGGLQRSGGSLGGRKVTHTSGIGGNGSKRYRVVVGPRQSLSWCCKSGGAQDHSHLLQADLSLREQTARKIVVTES